MLKIQKPQLLEKKIIDYQWSSVSALNNMMFVYVLYSSNDIKADKRIKGLVNAMYEAEHLNNGFFKQFVEFLDSDVQDHIIDLEKQVSTIDKSNHNSSEIKNLFWEAIYTNMNEYTLNVLFGK